MVVAVGAVATGGKAVVVVVVVLRLLAATAAIVSCAWLAHKNIAPAGQGKHGEFANAFWVGRPATPPLPPMPTLAQCEFAGGWRLCCCSTDAAAASAAAATV